MKATKLPEGVFATLSEFVTHAGELSLMARMAATVTGMKEHDPTTHAVTLNAMLAALKPFAQRDKQLQIEMDDPAFAKAYRHCFKDIRGVVGKLEDAIREQSRLQLGNKIVGPWGLRVISLFDEYPNIEEPSTGWEWEVKDSQPYLELAKQLKPKPSLASRMKAQLSELTGIGAKIEIADHQPVSGVDTASIDGNREELASKQKLDM